SARLRRSRRQARSRARAAARVRASEGEDLLDAADGGLAVPVERDDLERQLPVVPMLVEDTLDRAEVDLPGAGLVTSGHIGDVNRRDPIEGIDEVVDQPSAAELLVVAVEEHRHLRMIDLAAKLERGARVLEEVAGGEDGIDRLDDELHRLPLD